MEKQTIKLTCNTCNKEIVISKRKYDYETARRNQSKFFCSDECFYRDLSISKSTKQLVGCLQCKKEFYKELNQVNKFPNHFCSRSCAASYNNIHKSYGIRRSKLEDYLEECIRKYYPELELICNSKEVIGSELDFYFPKLRFAIELNGIVHYEPIYGKDKLHKIQCNDDQKIIKCYEKGIELAIIDSSSCINLTQTNKNKFWEIVNDLLFNINKRVRENDPLTSCLEGKRSTN